MMNKFYKPRKVTMKIYESVKYELTAEEAENAKTVVYTDCIGFEVVGGAEAAEIEADTDGSCIDEYHEYCVLHFADGSISTFRNSHCDLFCL